MNKPAGSLQAAPADTKARFTTAEFLRMAEAGAFEDMKVELVDGALERTTPPYGSHAGRLMQIGIKLGAVADPSRIAGDVGIKISEDTVLACDVALLRDGVVLQHRLVRTDEVLLVIEVAETTIARDLGMKRTKYAAVGIPTYWVVDGSRSVTHVYAEPIDGDYADISTVRFGQPLAVPGTGSTILLA